MNTETPTLTQRHQANDPDAPVYIFYEDPGHGWLAVPRPKLKALGILDLISQCSYQRGLMVFLEEDCDAGEFIAAMGEAGKPFTVDRVYQEETPIRNYQPFSMVGN